MAVDALLQRILAWAESAPDVRAVRVVGSRGRRVRAWLEANLGPDLGPSPRPRPVRPA